MSHLRQYHSQQANDTFENQVERAQRTVDRCPEEYKEWCQLLLYILKQHKYTTVISKTGIPIDVHGIASYNEVFISFFGVYNRINRFDTSIPPIETQKLNIEHKSIKLYENNL